MKATITTTTTTTSRSTSTSTSKTSKSTQSKSTAFVSMASTSSSSASTETQKTPFSSQTNRDKTNVGVYVTIPVVVFVFCAAAAIFFVIRRRYRKKRLPSKPSERVPGISMSNDSYEDHHDDICIPSLSTDEHVPGVGGDEYAEIVVKGNALNEQRDEYHTIEDVVKILPNANTSYSHVNVPKALILDNNYSHIENNNKNVSKTGDYGFSMFKRGIFHFKKSFKKESNSSYDNLEMKTVAYDPNKPVKDVAMAELESEYNHTRSVVPDSINKDIQNEKDEYSHLDHRPKSMKAHSNEIPNKTSYSVQSQLTSELPANLRANGYENEVDIGHDYFVLEAVGESGDDTIEDSDKSKFEERNSNSASGFQYEYAREIKRSGTYQNEETKDMQSAFHYELSKDIEKNLDIANKADDVGDSLGTSSAKEDENQNHHYFILSKT